MIGFFHKSSSKDSLQFANDFSNCFESGYETNKFKLNGNHYKKRDSDLFTASDLNDYFDNMQSYRSANSLILRRPKVSIKLHSKSVSDSKFVVHPLEVDQFLEVMNGNNPNMIIEMSDNITKLCDVTPSAMSNIIASNEAIQCYINALQSSVSEDVTKSLLISLSCFFPFCGNKMVDIVDLLYLEFSQLLEETTPSTILPSINLIISISRHSAYGRNSLISAGIHELLINMAMSTDDPEVAVSCCLALESTFTEVENKDFETLIQPGVLMMVQLLTLPYTEANAAILSSFSSIITQVPIASNKLCESSQIHLKLLESLSNDDLQEEILRLISKISRTANITYVKEMIENNLIPILIEFIGSDQTSLSIHIISLLLERIPEEVFSLLPEEFNDNIIEIAFGSPFDIKKQAVFLIATELYKLSPDEIENLMKPEAIQLLVDMLSSDQNDIMLQCLLALGKITQVAVLMGKEKECAEYLNDTDIVSILESLGEDRLKTVDDRAISLLKKLEPILSTDSL